MSVRFDQVGFAPFDVAIGNFVYLIQGDQTVVLEHSAALVLAFHLADHLPPTPRQSRVVERGCTPPAGLGSLDGSDAADVAPAP